LIQAVAAANPRTIVVLNAGGSVESMSWIDSVAALVHAFYPGQAGGTALAEMLFGQTNPSGKLPFSWEKRWEESAAYEHYPLAANPEANDYKEGLLLGYRWFDTQKIAPLFPFGFGLSYTQFELSVFGRVKGMAGAGGAIQFSVDVRNTGKCAGAEVVQVYAENPAGQPGRPVHELKAYGKVFLQPGEKRTLTLNINPADLAAWDAATHGWVPARGERTFLAGDSSRNLPLQTVVSL
jgi:beta-glucosidase